METYTFNNFDIIISNLNSRSITANFYNIHPNCSIIGGRGILFTSSINNIKVKSVDYPDFYEHIDGYDLFFVMGIVRSRDLRDFNFYNSKENFLMIMKELDDFIDNQTFDLRSIF